jgi:hypothetical protein
MCIFTNMSSSLVQARLNSKSISAINPDYYIDNNRVKLHICDIDHVKLNGGTLTLSRDLIHRRRVCATVVSTTTVQLPSPELCIGVELRVEMLAPAVCDTAFIHCQQQCIWEQCTEYALYIDS